MASNDVENFLDTDQNKSFRELLIQLVNNREISSLLVGETHDISPTWAMLLANMDVLTQSPRNIVLIFEHLNQKDNSALTKALEKKQTEFNNPLKKIEPLKTGNPEIFIASLAAVNNHIAVLGAENKKSNPFGGYKDHEMDSTIIKEMQKFQKSPERITVTNEVFANLVLKCCDNNTLPIFIGGAAHPIALSLGTKQYDPGLQGRIKDSVSLYLVESRTPFITEKAAYLEEDRGVQGTYDYKVMTNKTTLYQEVFDSAAQLKDKIELLNNILNGLIKGHLLFKQKSNFAMDEELQSILPAFQKSAGTTIKFSHLEAYITKLLQEKDQRTSSKHGFFSLKKEAKPAQSYSPTALREVLLEDIAPSPENTNTSSLGGIPN